MKKYGLHTWNSDFIVSTCMPIGPTCLVYVVYVNIHTSVGMMSVCSMFETLELATFRESA